MWSSAAPESPDTKRCEGGEGCEGAYGQSGGGFLRLGLFGVLFDGFQQVGDELGGRSDGGKQVARVRGDSRRSA